MIIDLLFLSLGILGAIFLIISDNIARSIISPTEIPIGIITSCVGSPYLIYLILKNNKKIIKGDNN